MTIFRNLGVHLQPFYYMPHDEKLLIPIMGFTREKRFHYLTSKGKAGWNWYKHLYQRSPWYKKTLIVVLTFIASFIIYLGMVDVNFLWLFGKSPGLSSIHNPNQPIASEIYSEDGKLIGKFFRENRSPVKYEEISRTNQNIDFYRRRTLLRAFRVDLKVFLP